MKAAGVPTGSSDQAAAFGLEEYKLLRAEVENRAKEQRETERNVVIITAAILLYLASNGAPGSSPAPQPNEVARPIILIGWLLLPVVSLVGLARWLESLALIRQLAIYMRQAEITALGSGGGWETHLHAWRKSKKGLPLITFASALFWSFMTFATTILSVHQIFVQPSLSAPGWSASVWIGLLATVAALILIVRSKLNDPTVD